MEHCPAFRRVILHFWVYSLRVTNPFAEGLNPLDLHALSTLPAFILSQDQTLSRTRLFVYKKTKWRADGHKVT